MDVIQRYITDYEIFADDAFVYEIKQLDKDTSIAVAERIFEISEDIPSTNGEVLSFCMIADVQNKEDKYFIIDFLNEESEPIILLYIEEITLDEYLDLILDQE